MLYVNEVERKKNKAKRKKGRPSSLTEEQIDDIIRMYNAGDSYNEIAIEKDLSKSTIYRIIKSRTVQDESK